MKTTIEGLKKILEEASPKQNWADADLSDDLWEQGLLDSFSIVALIGLFEERLGIVFDYTELNRANFISIEAIANLLRTKFGVEIA